MSTKRYRKKSVLFLIAIILFAYFVSKKFDKVEINNIESNSYLLSEEVQEVSDEGNTTERLFFTTDEDLNPVERVYPKLVLYEGDVLSAGSCRTPNFIYDTNRICSVDIGEIESDLPDQNGLLSVGETIEVTSDVYLSEVEVPPLINGSRQMDSSVRQIYSAEYAKDDVDHWTLRPDGEMIERQVAMGNMYPNDDQTIGLVVKAEEYSKTVPFSVKYSIDAEGDSETSGSNEITIQEYQENNCGEKCRNYHNPTPEKFMIYSYLQTRRKNYPGHYEKTLANSGETEPIEACDSNTEFITMDDIQSKITGCTSLVEKIVITLKKKIENLIDADRCSDATYTDSNGNTITSDEECINTAELVVIMDSPWGDENECEVGEEGPCVTEYNNLRTGNYAIPGGDEDKKYYLLTNCTLFVPDIGINDIPAHCAWEINHVADELRFQSFDNLPGEDYPEESEYIDFQVEQAEIRTDSVIPMSM